MLHGPHKIFNDPVYGFVKVPYGILFELVEHPYFQRLRRISQLGLSCYVYPGAYHTRFHHAIGALHLTMQALEVLKAKGVEISEAEAEATCIAILLHDIGHGPFSHALEHTLLTLHHEELSVLLMQQLNIQFNGRLSLAIQIFLDNYSKKFLHQLVSGQLDMDRMDYLNRDSYFTGVSEGVIGYDRIIKMLAVCDNELVIEQKGVYSIEKFLIARRLMYWQVYLHKTVLCAEQMLIKVLLLAKKIALKGGELKVSDPLHYFLYSCPSKKEVITAPEHTLEQFVRLDDVDILSAMKSFVSTEHQMLSYLSESILTRNLFRVELQSKPFDPSYIQSIRSRVSVAFGDDDKSILDSLVISGKEENRLYTTNKEEIKILWKDGSVRTITESSDYDIDTQIITKYYLCYPKSV